MRQKCRWCDRPPCQTQRDWPTNLGVCDPLPSYQWHELKKRRQALEDDITHIEQVLATTDLSIEETCEYSDLLATLKRERDTFCPFAQFGTV